MSIAAQIHARVLFKEGADLHREAFYQQALDKYEQALGYWKHPEIYFNMGCALRDLRRPVDAYRALREATRFGPQSLLPDEYQRAQQYLREFESQLAHLKVTCDVDAAVYVDGQRLFHGRNSVDTVLLPGPHRIVARGRRYVDDERWLQLSGGQREVVSLHPLAREQIASVDIRCVERGADVILDGQPFMACPGRKTHVLSPDIDHTVIITHPERRPDQLTFSVKPGQRLPLSLHTLDKEDHLPGQRLLRRSLLAGGLMGAVVSVVLRVDAHAGVRRYELVIDTLCAPNGCPLSQVTDAHRYYNLAVLKGRIALALMSVSGVSLVAGLSLNAWLRRRQRSDKNRARAHAVVIQPTVSTEEIGIVTRIRF